MTWALVGQFLGLVIGSGACAAAFNQFFEHRRRRASRTDEAEYLAIRLAFVFEAFALQCVNNIADHDLFRQSGGAAGEELKVLPEVPALPHSEAYKLLDRELLHDVLEFSPRWQMADQFAMFHWNVDADADATKDAMYEKTVELGVWTLSMADRLRRHYDLRSRNLGSGEYSPIEILRAEQKKIRDRRDTERRARSRTS